MLSHTDIVRKLCFSNEKMFMVEQMTRNLWLKLFDMMVGFDYINVYLHYQHYLSHIFEEEQDGTAMPSCSSSTPFTVISTSSQKAREPNS